MNTNFSALQSISYAAMPRISSGGRAYLPVPENQLVYSHFKYVSGVPEDKTKNGVNVEKLSLLNMMIDQLVSMKPASGKANFQRQTSAVSDVQIGKMIGYYSQEVKNAKAAAAITGYGSSILPARILNLTA